MIAPEAFLMMASTQTDNIDQLLLSNISMEYLP